MSTFQKLVLDIETVGEDFDSLDKTTQESLARWIKKESESESEYKEALEDIDVTTPRGQELAGKHLIFASPGIILNGELFSTGGVNEEKFLSKIKELSQ